MTDPNPIDFFVLYFTFLKWIAPAAILLSMTTFLCYLVGYGLAKIFRYLYNVWKLRELRETRRKLDNLYQTILSMIPCAELGQVLDAEQYAAWEREQMFVLWRVIYDKRGASTSEEATKQERSSAAPADDQDNP